MTDIGHTFREPEAPQRLSARITLPSILIATWITIICACGGSRNDASEATDQQALFDEPTTCSAAMLTGPTCRGPWAYRQYQHPCFAKGADPACGTMTGTCPGSCVHAQSGGSYSALFLVGCVRCSTSALNTQCAESVDALKNSVAGDRSIVTASGHVTDIEPGVNDDGLRTLTGDCNVTLTNAADGVNAACPTVSCQVNKTCRLTKFGEDPNPAACSNESNTFDPNQYASTSGLTIAQVAANQRYLNPTTTDCSTLEDRQANADRLALTVARSSGSNGFWTTLPADDALEVAARHDLVKEAKLMFELGVPASGVSADTLRALYDSAPADEMSCGVSARPPVSDACRSWGTAQHLDGPLGLCQRILSTHVAGAVFDAEINRCLDLLGQAAFAGTDACAVEYRGVTEALEEKLVAKGLSNVQMAADGVTIAGLATTLARIDRWYTAAALAYAGDAASLSDATGRVLAGFWTRVYAVGSPIPTFVTGEAGSGTAQTQLSTLFTARLEVDRQVLAAAFANPAPLDEVPLLLIVSDGFTEINDRLVMAAPLYDLACRIKGSCTVSEANEATKLIRLIGALGSDAALADALTAAGGGTTVRAPWRDLFTALRAQRSALEAAFRKATANPNATLDKLYTFAAAGPAAGLAEQVVRSKTLWDRYASHGVLLPEDGTLRTSLTSANVAAALTTFQDRITMLRANRTDYQKARGDLAQTIVNRITNKQFEDRVNNEAGELRMEYDNLGSDLDGLMDAQDRAEQLIGNFLATYIARASSPGWLPDYPISGHPTLLSLNATDARGQGGPAADVTAVAVLDPADRTTAWHVDFDKGDLLTFEVANTWSPTCSLRGTSVATPDGTVGFADPTHLQVGPEGFTISEQNQQFVGHKLDSTTFSSHTTTESICATVGGGGNLGPISMSTTASLCTSWQQGHSDSTTDSNGTQFQYDANFADGLRLPTTPFPALPAGSLILVEVVDGSQGPTIRDAHVVRAHSTFLFPQAGRAYLVVNDKGGCNPLDTSPLSVTYVLGKSSAAAAASLAQTMATVLTALQSAKATYIAEGSVTPSELSALQSAAYDQLRSSCRCQLSAFPDEVRGMFDAWLSAELASIERAVRIAAAGRALDTLVLKLKGLQDDLAGASSSSRLLTLMTYWQLGNLAFQLGDPDLPLRDHAGDLLASAGDMLALMRILYPQALAALNASPGALNSLRTFDWTLPYDEQVMNLEAMADAITQRINDAKNSGGLSTASIAVVFPRPGSPVTVPGSITAPPERLKGVWQPCSAPSGFCLSANPVFALNPEDVYGRPLVGLGCREASPVVQGVAIVAVNEGLSDNDDWNNNPRRGDVLRASEMEFPTEHGILNFRTDGPGAILAPSRLRVLAGADSEVATKFDTYIRKGGGDLQGVSPFNTFTVALGDAVTTAPTLTSATAMVVYFDVQTRTASDALTAVASCIP